MLSLVNAFGGLSAAELMTLFGVKSSSSSSATSTNTTQSPPIGVSGSSANNPAKAIAAILAQAQIDRPQTATLGGGSAISVTAEAAYASEAGGSASLLSANVTVSSPGAAQQIADAVSEINSVRIYAQYAAPPNNYGIICYDDPIIVTAADAVNITISNGAISATAMQGAAFPGGLPSLTSIQQAYDSLKESDQGTQSGTLFDGNFTLVKLPSNTEGGSGGNFITFGTMGENDSWALVLPQNTVSVTVSDTQTKG